MNAKRIVRACSHLVTACHATHSPIIAGGFMLALDLFLSIRLDHHNNTVVGGSNPRRVRERLRFNRVSIHYVHLSRRQVDIDGHQPSACDGRDEVEQVPRTIAAGPRVYARRQATP
jgi:hypothetical protein